MIKKLPHNKDSTHKSTYRVDLSLQIQGERQYLLLDYRLAIAALI